MRDRGGAVVNWLGWERQELVELSGEVSFEASQCALGGLSLGCFTREVLLGGRVVAGAGERDDVQRVVELAVPATV